MMTDFVKATIELLIGFKWPIALIIVALLFRKPFANVIVRIKDIGMKDVRAGFSPQTLAGEQTPTSELLRELDNVVLSPVLREYENIFRKQLEEHNILNREGLVDYFVRALSIATLNFGFEMVNSHIWQSQISILQDLNGKQDGETIIYLKTFYDVAASTYPEVFHNYPYEQYLNFLVSNSLIAQQGERFLITPMGREFLAHLARTGKTAVRKY